jgi:hypothetical protein
MGAIKTTVSPPQDGAYARHTIGSRVSSNRGRKETYSFFSKAALLSGRFWRPLTKTVNVCAVARRLDTDDEKRARPGAAPCVALFAD